MQNGGDGIGSFINYYDREAKQMILWGDLHNHCGITYGFGSLENALRAAHAHLDFCAVTGHAMWPDIYERNQDTAYIIDFHKAGFKKLGTHGMM